MYILSFVFVVGLSGITAEITLLRELLILSEGNELVLGIIIANWMIVQAIGALITSKLIRNSNLINEVVFFTIGFIAYFPVSILLSRVSKFGLGYVVGQPVDFFGIFLISFTVLFLLGFFHNGLFIILSEYNSLFNEKNISIRNIYMFELLGTSFGGVFLPFLILQRFNTFQICFIGNIVFVISLMFFLRKVNLKIKGRWPYYISGIFLIINLICFFYSKRIDLAILSKFYNQNVLESKNSATSNIVITKNENQLTFYSQGIPSIISPSPSELFDEELVCYSLCSINKVKNLRVAIFGGGIGKNGILDRLLLTERVDSIDYIEIDPLIIKLYLKYVTFDNKNVNFYAKDIVSWINNLDKRKKYDIVYLMYPNPKSLLLNRFYTADFFKQIKKILCADGTFLFIGPGNENYMSFELRQLVKSYLITAKEIFENVIFIPADTSNIFLAKKIKENIYEKIKLKMTDFHSKIIDNDFLEYRLNYNKIDKINNDLNIIAKINNNYNPSGLWYGLKYSALQFNPLLLKIYNFIEKTNVFLIVLATILFFLVVLVTITKIMKTKSNILISYSIFSTSVAGITGSILCMFLTQIIKGFIYSYTVLFISFFLLGSVLGSLAIKKIVKNFSKWFLLFDLGIIFIFINILFLRNIFILFILDFIIGFFAGAQYNLAVKDYTFNTKKSAREITSSLNFWDLFGGGVAGIFVIPFLFPSSGLNLTCLFIIILKVISIFLSFTKNLRVFSESSFRYF